MSHYVELPEGTESLSHTRRDTYRVCPRMYFYRYELGLHPLDTPAPLRMGAIISDALELRNPAHAEKEYARLVAEAISEQKQELVEQLLHEQAVVVAAATEKLKRPEMNEKGLQPEVPFIGKQANGFVDNGRWDAVKVSDSGILIVERKFKTYFSGTWARELVMDDQITSYIANAIDTYDVELSEIFVRFEVMWKPRTRPTKADATPEAKRLRYAQLLTTKHDDHHTILLPGDEVLRRNHQQLQDWWDRFERTSEDILRDRELAKGDGPEAWVQHTHSCFRFNSDCAFLGLCTAATPEEFTATMKREFTTPAQRAEAKRLLDEVADED